MIETTINKRDVKFPVMEGPAVYEIRVSGRIDASWVPRLEGMTNVETSRSDTSSETILVGRLADQAALSGVLATLYELHLPVVKVECLEVE